MSEKLKAGDAVAVKDSYLGLLMTDPENGLAWLCALDNSGFQIEVPTTALRLDVPCTDESRTETLRKAACGVRPLVAAGAIEVARRQWLDEHALGSVVRRYDAPNPFAPYPSPAFENAAGRIQNVVEGSFSGCAVIESKRGAVRSNHWHRTDSHHLHLLSGSCLYWELAARATDATEFYEPPGKPWLCRPGDTIFTGPEHLHAIAYLEDTVMISCSSLPRDHESHERDLVRVPGWVGREVLSEIAPWIEWRC